MSTACFFYWHTPSYRSSSWWVEVTYLLTSARCAATVRRPWRDWWPTAWRRRERNDLSSLRWDQSNAFRFDFEVTDAADFYIKDRKAAPEWTLEMFKSELKENSMLFSALPPDGLRGFHTGKKAADCNTDNTFNGFVWWWMVIYWFLTSCVYSVRSWPPSSYWLARYPKSTAAPQSLR